MSETKRLCPALKTSEAIADVMTTTLATIYDPNNPGPISEGNRQGVQTVLKFKHDAELIGDVLVTPDKTKYECQFTCEQCLGRVMLGVHGELAEYHRPIECEDPEAV